MNECDEIKARFKLLYETRPSSIRTTLFVGPTGWIFRILGILLVIAGLGLGIASELGVYIPNATDFDHELTKDEKAYRALTFFYGMAVFISGLIFFSIGKLCQWIVRRNFYIMQLEELFQNKTDNTTS